MFSHFTCSKDSKNIKMSSEEVLPVEWLNLDKKHKKYKGNGHNLTRGQFSGKTLARLDPGCRVYAIYRGLFRIEISL